ncbi:LysR family transcriptional regulator [Denitratimonas tolerans]|uniref:LysR family transcriptional regulator n=1 Tax=Denitratimonas tolerans TaxID=1338420 RepID=A0AAW9RDQ3_9GAMM
MSDAAAWDLYRTFLAVLREGSLSAAARALGLTQPTVGRQIAALEAALGLALFTRAPQGLTPTGAALDLLPHAEAMEAAAATLVRAVSGDALQPRGTVRLSASEVIGCEVLPPMLADFREAHPQVALELLSSNRLTNLLTREADLAVRMIRPTQGALIARQVGRVRIGLYAHCRYAERYGLPERLDELRRHAAIGFDTDRRAIEALAAAGVIMSREDFVFRSDDELAQLAALRAGLGIGALPAGVAARDPQLLPVLPGRLSFELEVWLAMHEDLRAVRRIRLLFDHLAEALADYCRAG